MSFRDDSRAVLPSMFWEQVSQLVERFEVARRNGERPALEDYLPTDAAARRAALLELIHIRPIGQLQRMRV